MPDDQVRNLEALEAARRPGVVVSPSSPYPFDHDDFAALVWELINETELMADAVEFRLAYLYGDAGPPGWTWIDVILDKSASAAVDAIVRALVVWGRDWIRKARKRDAEAAPIKAVIYGPQGEVLREVEVPPEEP
jgi:hypothetical protein